MRRNFACHCPLNTHSKPLANHLFTFCYWYGVIEPNKVYQFKLSYQLKKLYYSMIAVDQYYYNHDVIFQEIEWGSFLSLNLPPRSRRKQQQLLSRSSPKNQLDSSCWTSVCSDYGHLNLKWTGSGMVVRYFNVVIYQDVTSSRWETLAYSYT